MPPRVGNAARSRMRRDVLGSGGSSRFSSLGVAALIVAVVGACGSTATGPSPSSTVTTSSTTVAGASTSTTTSTVTPPENRTDRPVVVDDSGTIGTPADIVAQTPFGDRTDFPAVERVPGETGANAGPTDGRAIETVIDLVDLGYADITDYWQRTLPAVYGLEYKPIERLLYYNYGQAGAPAQSETRCWQDDPDYLDGVYNNALYCPLDGEGSPIATGRVLFDGAFLESLVSEYGDMLPIFVIAHEMGHHINNITSTNPELPIQEELKADCLAGAYMAHAGESGNYRLNQGDTEEPLTWFLLTVPQSDLYNEFGWLNPGWHGTATERASATLLGFNSGDPSVCAQLDDYVAGPVITLFDYELALPNGAEVSVIAENKRAIIVPAYPGIPIQVGVYSVPQSWNGRTAAEVIDATASTWSGTAPMTRLGLIYDQSELLNSYRNRPGTAALFQYQQTVAGDTINVTVHGLFYVWLDGNGQIFVADIFTSGPAPVGWDGSGLMGPFLQVFLGAGQVAR